MSAAITPQCVVTLVHGTFSPRARWSFTDSEFCRQLDQEWGGTGSLVFRRIAWPGFWRSFLNNGHGYRLAGGQTLAASLNEAMALHPNAQHWVIAHSHGGNVALYALRDPVVAAHLTGIVAMATPFIDCRPRRLDRAPIKLVAQGIGVVFWVLGFPLAGLAFYAFTPTSARIVYWAGLSIITIATLAYWSRLDAVLDRLPHWQRNTVDRLSVPAPTHQRVLCQSVPLDEARVWLAWLYAAGEWPHWLWSGLVYLPLLLVAFLVALIFGDGVVPSMAGNAGVARVARAFDATLGWALLISTAHVFIMAIVPVLTRGWGIGFGRESVWDNLLVNIRQTLRPVGAPHVREERYSFKNVRGLRHSSLYESQEAIAAIARFMHEGAPAPPGSRGPDVGQREIVAHKQQGIVGDDRRGIGEAVAEVEGRLVATATEAHKRRDRGVPFTLAEGHDGNAQFLHQLLHLGDHRRPPAAGEDHAGLDQRGCGHAYAVGREDAVDEIEVTLFSEQDRDERGGVERQTPPGP